MRIVTYGAACSLDGYIAAADGSLDWLHFSKDVQKEMQKYWKTVDTVLFGRKTWEVSNAMGGGGTSQSPISSFVFSRTLTTVPDSVQLVSSDAVEFVRALKRQPGKGICVMGGGELGAALIDGGVVDEVGLNIHPILLGAGVPLFRNSERVAFELIESRTIDGGCVLCNYRSINSRTAPA
jgi:dihydrofolate reductase